MIDLDDSELQDQIAFSELAKQRLGKLTVRELRTLGAYLLGVSCRDWTRAELIDNLACEHAETILSGGRWS